MKTKIFLEPICFSLGIKLLILIKLPLRLKYYSAPIAHNNMQEAYIQDQTFEKVDFIEKPLAKGEYDNCNFNQCDFSNTDFSDIVFIDCTFNHCNISLVKLIKTTFRDIVFKDCKMFGLRFDDCSQFGLAFRFENCSLNHSSFYGTKITKTVFKNTQLHEVDFTECDLTGSTLDSCDFKNAMFDRTVLEKVDLRRSYNYVIDPDSNRVRKAKFSLMGVVGLLRKYDIEVDGS